MVTEAGHLANRCYFDQQGNYHPNGSVEFDGNENPLAMLASFTPAAGAANVCLVTIQLKDGGGNNLPVVVPLDVWLSDNATGIGLTATTASGAVGAGASGTDIWVGTAKKALRSLTDATGKYVLSITDTLKTGFVPCCSIAGTGQIAAGARLVAGNYG
jgi:hypothetical protein